MAGEFCGRTLCLPWAGMCRILGTLSSNLTKNKSFMKGLALSSDAKLFGEGPGVPSSFILSNNNKLSRVCSVLQLTVKQQANLLCDA